MLHLRRTMFPNGYRSRNYFEKSSRQHAEVEQEHLLKTTPTTGTTVSNHMTTLESSQEPPPPILNSFSVIF
jgi:hypothetical protein